MFDRVIVPLDGSPFAADAIPWALQLPARSALLIRVEPNLPMAGGELAGFDYAKGQATTAAADTSALEAAGAPLRDAGLAVSTVVRVNDDPAAAIIDEAKPGDVIVMTTHGRGSIGRIIYGSIADRVARHAVVPTLLVRPGAHIDGPKRIVVPIDGSPVAEVALPVAAAIAKARSIPIHLLRIVDLNDVLRELRADRPSIDAPVLDTTFDDTRREVESEASRHLSVLAAPLEAAGLHITTRVEGGSPAQGILDAIGPSDLLVMTSRGRGGLKRWLIGSVADKLVRESPAPVLLVRPQQELV